MGADKLLERRKADRKRQRLPVRYWDPHDARTFSGVLADESESGAFIETHEFLPLRTTIRIEGPGLVCHAEVVRVFFVPPGDEQPARSGMAVKLIDRREDLGEAEIEDESGRTLLVFPQRALR